MTGHPEQAIDRFQEAVAGSKDDRVISWSHIYLGRMLDLDCKRDAAVAEYKLALQHRDGQQDTRMAAEHGLKSAYAVNGHSCRQDDANESPASAPPILRPHRHNLLLNRSKARTNGREKGN